MTMKQQIVEHDRQIKAIRGLIHEGMRIVVQTRQEARKSTLRMQRIEAALELQITGKHTNGKGEPDAPTKR
jgi:hypothetical protein